MQVNCCPVVVGKSTYNLIYCFIISSYSGSLHSPPPTSTDQPGIFVDPVQFLSPHVCCPSALIHLAMMVVLAGGLKRGFAEESNVYCELVSLQDN